MLKFRSGYIVENIHPCEAYAERMLELRFEALRSAGLNLGESKTIANPENIDHIIDQKDKLWHTRRFLGVFALKDYKLVGFSDIYEWTRKDYLPYCGGAEWLYNAAKIKSGSDSFSPEAIGIHELVVDEKENLDSNISRMLLEKAIELADSREIYYASDGDVNIAVSLLKQEFRSTSQFASVNGLHKELYHRPALVREHAHVGSGHDNDSLSAMVMI